MVNFIKFKKNILLLDPTLVIIYTFNTRTFLAAGSSSLPLTKAGTADCLRKSVHHFLMLFLTVTHLFPHSMAGLQIFECSGNVSLQFFSSVGQIILALSTIPDSHMAVSKPLTILDLLWVLPSLLVIFLLQCTPKLCVTWTTHGLVESFVPHDLEIVYSYYCYSHET